MGGVHMDYSRPDSASDITKPSQTRYYNGNANILINDFKADSRRESDQKLLQSPDFE